MRIKTITSSEYFRSVFKLTIGSLLAQVITIGVSPITTRLYTPKELGTYTLIITISAMFSPVLSGKYDMAIVSAENEEEVMDLIIISLLFSLFFIPLITLGYNFYLNSKPEIFIEVGNFAYVLILILIVNALINILNNYNNRFKEYNIISYVYVLRTIFQNLGLVIFGFFNLGSIGLLLSQLLGLLVGVKKQGEKLYKAKSLFKGIKVSSLKQVFKKYRNQPIYSMPAHFISSASYSILNFFISGLFGLSIFGYYSMTYRIMGLPLSLVSMNVSKVFFQRATEEKKNKGNYKQTLKQITTFLVLLSIPMVFILILLGPTLFEFFLGKGWQVSGNFARLLAPMYGFRFIVSALTPALVVSGKQKLELMIQTLFIVSSLISYFICKLLSLNIEMYLVMISVSYSLIYLYLYGVIYMLSKKEN